MNLFYLCFAKVGQIVFLPFNNYPAPLTQYQQNIHRKIWISCWNFEWFFIL